MVVIERLHMNRYFSVVIPAYNAAAYIEKALESVRSQTFTDYEVIVVNDGSADDTGSVLSAYGRRFDQFPLTVVAQANKGIGGARNSGLFRAKGEFIAFLDSDDSWYPEKLQNVFDFLQAHQDVDVACHYEMATDHNGYEKLLKYESINNESAYSDLLFNGNRLSPSATVVKRELAQSIGGFSEDLKFNSAEDYEFWLRLAKEGAVFAVVPDVLGIYSLEANSITSKIAYHHNKIQNVLDHHFKIISAYYPDQSAIAKYYVQRKAVTVFAAARSYYLAGKYGESVTTYIESIKINPYRWKSYAGIIQAAAKYLLNCTNE